MAKIVGIIAEFNPFHKGHEYIIKRAKEDTGASYVIAVISGDYVQRGEPAIIDKYARTKMALMAGIDAIYCLPSAISTGSAQYFARGGVALLDALGADYIFFGSEDGTLSSIKDHSYEKGIVNTPNNILANEYLNAIDYLNLNITPYTTKRIGSDYNDTNNVIDDVCSASYIRKILYSDDISSLSKLMPSYAYDIITEYMDNNKLISLASYDQLLAEKLIQGAESGFSSYFDIFDDLSKKIQANTYSYKDAYSFIALLKSKDITYSHICRSICHILINCTKGDMAIIESYKYAPYARLLGFKKESQAVVGIIKDKCTIPYIAKLSEYKENVPGDIAMLISKDIYASHLYSYICKGSIVHEYTRPLVIV